MFITEYRLRSVLGQMTLFFNPIFNSQKISYGAHLWRMPEIAGTFKNHSIWGRPRQSELV